MTWIRDCDGYMVNIDKWDFLNVITVEDTLLETSVFYKIYLQSRDKQECLLGYFNINKTDFEEIQEQIIKGCSFHFDTLDQVIKRYIYFRKEQDVEWSDEVTYNEKRFKESE